MNEKSAKGLAVLMAVAGTLAPELDTTVAIPVETQKERTIRKCADPKKKAKRKMAQSSQRKNRR